MRCKGKNLEKKKENTVLYEIKKSLFLTCIYFSMNLEWEKVIE